MATGIVKRLQNTQKTFKKRKKKKPMLITVPIKDRAKNVIFLKSFHPKQGNRSIRCNCGKYKKTANIKEREQ